MDNEGPLSIEEEVLVKNWVWGVSDLISKAQEQFIKEHPEWQISWTFKIDACRGNYCLHTETCKE